MQHEQIATAQTDTVVSALTYRIAAAINRDVVYVAGALDRDADGNLTACDRDVARAARLVLEGWFRP